MSQMFFIGLGEVCHGKTFNKHLLGVRDSSTLKRRQKIGVLADDLSKLRTLLTQERYANSRNNLARRYLVFIQRHDDFADLVCRTIQHNRERLPGDVGWIS